MIKYSEIQIGQWLWDGERYLCCTNLKANEVHFNVYNIKFGRGGKDLEWWKGAVNLSVVGNGSFPAYELAKDLRPLIRAIFTRRILGEGGIALRKVLAFEV
jgi:hypothetical protein